MFPRTWRGLLAPPLLCPGLDRTLGLADAVNCCVPLLALPRSGVATDLLRDDPGLRLTRSVLICLAPVFSALFCLGLSCSVLLCVALSWFVLFCLALPCSVLTSLAPLCSTLLYVALSCDAVTLFTYTLPCH